MIQNLLDTVSFSLTNLWVQASGFLPALIGAIVVFVLGLAVAAILERLAERLIYYLKVDNLLNRAGLASYLHRAGLQLDAGHFLGRVVYWFIILAFILAASDTLGFYTLSGFLQGILYYIPTAIISALIAVATIIVANFLRGLVIASVLSAHLHSAKFLGSITWWAVLVFGLLTALNQLGVSADVLNNIVTGLIAMFALAGGIAFGLGGKDLGGRLLDKARQSWEHSG